jgi:DNA invertase Pin-like site-specific DNA recombinase
VSRRPAYCYLRASRGRRHRSNLRLVHQRALCRAFARANGFLLVEEFVEIEFGKGVDSLELRPVLRQCLDRAKQTDTPVIAASIDRLGRNVNFLARLFEDGVTFIVTGLSEPMQPVALGPFRRFAAAKRRNPARRNGKPVTVRTAAAKGRATIRQQADRFAAAMYGEIVRIRADGSTTLRAIADELNRQRIPTARGSRWTPTAVRRVVHRAESDG